MQVKFIKAIFTLARAKPTVRMNFLLMLFSLEVEDVLDTGADFGACAVVRLLLAVGCTDLHAHMRRGRLEAADNFVLRVDTDVILVAERVIAALSRPAPIPRKREETKALPRDRGGSAAPAGRPLAEAL